ncbi:MAG: hypothetical protein JWN48_1878 [Myxococcaceae bacterium]|nr:hypothetical protein [Myxococcaceae bacterium]
MAQYLKSAVEQRIAGAALSEFAVHGFRDTSMARIAKLSGVSTGNLYRYFESKEVLFVSVVPPELARRLLAKLRARVRTLIAAETLKQPGAYAAQRSASEELIALSTQHRLEIVILLGRSEGTIHQSFVEKVKRLLMRLAVFHLRGRDAVPLEPGLRDVLSLVYDNWVRSMVAILREHSEDSAIRRRVHLYTAYHLAGLPALFHAG